MTASAIPVAAFRFTADATSAINSTKSLATAVANLDKTSLQNIDSAIGGLTKRFAGLLPVIGVATLANFARSAIQAADAVGDAADRIGVSASALSRLKYVAEQSDVGFEDLTNSLKKYEVGLSNAARGEGKAGEALALLNLSARELKGLALEDQLARIADEFNRVSNPVDRTRIATELFEKSGDKLVPLLARGSAGIRELMEEADRLGITLDDKATKALDRSAKALDRFWSAAKSGISNFAGSIVAEVFGSGDELLDKEAQLKRLQDLLDRNAQGGSRNLSAENLKATQDEIAALEVQIARMRELQRLQSGVGSLSGGPSRRTSGAAVSAVEEIDLQAFRDFEAGLTARQRVRERDRQEQLRAAQQLESDIYKVQVDFAAASMDAHTEVERQITAVTIAELDRRSEAARNSRNREVEEARAAEEKKRQFYSATMDAATTLLTAYGGKYASIARAILAIDKAKAIKAAFMNTREAVTKALAGSAPPWNFISAAAVAAAGAVQIAAIASTVLGGGNSAPALGAPHNPVFTESAGGNDDRSAADQQTNQVIVMGNFYGNKEAFEQLWNQFFDRINNRNGQLIAPTSRQAQDIVKKRAP